MEEYTASFEYKDLNISPDLKNCILKLGYTAPTPIQDQAIPHIIEGKDVLGLADTGTGKTAAFLIPLIDRCLSAAKNREFFQTLIMAPTRELATQIEEELIKLTTRDMRIFSTALVGGRPIHSQISRIRKPNQFLIGTPGRLMDLVDRGALRLDKVNAVVLDEVDRMLDMGFVDDITFLIEQLPAERQSLFFSATLEKKLDNIVNSFLTDPVKISVKTTSASQNVHQDIVRVPRNEKIQALKKLLDLPECEKTLIFAETKSFTERLYEILADDGYLVESIHGDKSTGFRKRALDKFKSNKVKVLVATDVAARGIDVKDITHVINYDEPRDYETYIHRVGRAGRAGNTGWAYTLVS
jgi:ATP-dependent RNA helicase DeaD